MSASTFDQGDLVRVTARYAVGGSAIDPAVVIFKYLAPGASAVSKVYGTDAEVVRSAAGVYYVDVNANVEGQWYVQWTTTGTYQSAVEDGFYVRTSQF